MGCDMAQGYLLSRPVPAGQIADFVRVHDADALSALSPLTREAV
jgi:EAL domain-containing protein (putative c-di-GMP-specific phosphodiesterase class I)